MSAASGKHVLRIIGGQWRGRKIHFPTNEALRPTPDRVRETLFNWLMPVIQGARCLDLFAGSGVLGLEALSRGASKTVFVDSHRKSIEAMRETCKLFGADAAELISMDAMQYLQGQPTAFDIVFLDPPYASSLLFETAGSLQSRAWLSNNAFIYVEHDQHFDSQTLPAQWQLHRQKQAGQVYFSLYTVAN